MKAEVKLFLIESISEERSLYINAPDKRNLIDINKKMSDQSQAIKILDIKYIIFENKYSIFTQFRLGI